MVHTKYLDIVMVLAVVNSELHVMSLSIFPQGLRVNAVRYFNVLNTVVKP